jgi:ketosteroid isomerase-like protein
MQPPVLDRLFAALNSQDLAQVREQLAPDFVFEEVAGAGEPSIEALCEASNNPDP